MKLNYVIIPLITVLVAWTGSQFTRSGMDWYETLDVPSFTPPGWFIGTVWTILYVLAALSALIVWNSFSRTMRFHWIVGLFLANAFLNAFWCYLFFARHLIGVALGEMILLFGTVAALIVLIYPRSRPAAILLVPYGVWVGFASFLTIAIWRMNP